LAIPPEHLERLEADLAAHESWLRTLRLQIAALEAEASAHEMMLRLGRDPELLRALDELHDQPDLAERIAKDPRAFFEERGIELPDAASVTVTTDPERSAVEARFDNSPVAYGVGWSRADGFYLIAAPEPPEPPEPPNREET
jgi:xanthine/CO dehydrogenase XdhC/CoxF family maturation factor